jgi:hypothetical protein
MLILLIEPRAEVLSKLAGRAPVDEFARVTPGSIGDTHEFSIVSEPEKREAYWVRMITAQDFTSGLVICGLCHGLTLAFRLESAGITVANFVRPWIVEVMGANNCFAT